MIGHRGARSLFPENTIAGFRAAISAGVTRFEIDIAMTRDGVPVLSHDPYLSRDLTRDAHGCWLKATGPAIWDLRFAELAAFDVGRLRPHSRPQRRFPHQMPVDGATIPALEDALRLHGHALWTIEIKTNPGRPSSTARPEAIAEAVADAADRAGASGRITVQSFDWRGPRHLRRLRPDLAYAWLTTRSTRAWRGGQACLPGTVAAEGGGTWSPRHGELTPPPARPRQGRRPAGRPLDREQACRHRPPGGVGRGRPDYGRPSHRPRGARCGAVPAMTATLLVALGGALGSVARYWISLWALPLSRTLPYGTIGINIVGSFAIGFFGTLTMAQGRFAAAEPVRLFFMVGVCGGFTTFSSFSLQTLDLLRAGAPGRALVNVMLSVLLCIGAVTIGHVFAARLNGG